jgi:hypothetical protein
MALYTSPKIAKRICEALGLDHATVVDMTIKLPTRGFVTVDVTFVVDEPTASALLRELGSNADFTFTKRYHLVEVTD